MKECAKMSNPDNICTYEVIATAIRDAQRENGFKIAQVELEEGFLIIAPHWWDCKDVILGMRVARCAVSQPFMATFQNSEERRTQVKEINSLIESIGFAK